MFAACEVPMRDTPPPPPTPTTWRCAHCKAYLGRWLNGVLHEPNGNKSGSPVVRRCPNCGKRIVRLAAPH